MWRGLPDIRLLYRFSTPLRSFLCSDVTVLSCTIIVICIFLTQTNQYEYNIKFHLQRDTYSVWVSSFWQYPTRLLVATVQPLAHTTTRPCQSSIVVTGKYPHPPPVTRDTGVRFSAAKPICRGLCDDFDRRLSLSSEIGVVRTRIRYPWEWLERGWERVERVALFVFRNGD